MSESNIIVSPGAGGPSIDLELVDNGNARQVICIGDPTNSGRVMAVGANGHGQVDVNNFPAVQVVDGSAVTQPISAVSLPIPSGASTSANQTNGTQKTQLVDPISGQAASVDSTGDLQVDVMNPVQVAAATLCISVTGATGAGVTATLPAVAGQFHYITLIQVKKYFTVANAASATPLVVTATNLPGPLALTFGQPLGTIGSTDEDILASNSPLKSSVVNTPTTIVCPATTGIIWRINVYYFAAP